MRKRLIMALALMGVLAAACGGGEAATTTTATVPQTTTTGTARPANRLLMPSFLARDVTPSIGASTERSTRGGVRAVPTRRFAERPFSLREPHVAA